MPSSGRIKQIKRVCKIFNQNEKKNWECRLPKKDKEDERSLSLTCAMACSSNEQAFSLYSEDAGLIYCSLLAVMLSSWIPVCILTQGQTLTIEEQATHTPKLYLPQTDIIPPTTDTPGWCPPTPMHWQHRLTPTYPVTTNNPVWHQLTSNPKKSHNIDPSQSQCLMSTKRKKTNNLNPTMPLTEW